MLRWLTRRGVQRGLLGDSRGWFGLLIVVSGLRLLRRLTHSEPRVVFSEELEVGETLVITKGTPVAGWPPEDVKLDT